MGKKPKEKMTVKLDSPKEWCPTYPIEKRLCNCSDCRKR